MDLKLIIKGKRNNIMYSLNTFVAYSSYIYTLYEPINQFNNRLITVLYYSLKYEQFPASQSNKLTAHIVSKQ